MVYRVEISQDEWDKGPRRSTLTSVSLALSMKPGEYARITHRDTFCDGHSCNLRSALRRQPGKWHFKHEGPGVALLWREK